MRVTQISRDDNIDAIEQYHSSGMWIIRDRQSPVRIYNFKIKMWDYAHLIDGIDQRHLIPKNEVIEKLKSASRLHGW